jgi:DNA-binding transcriptional ArsR family regulator
MMPAVMVQGAVNQSVGVLRAPEGVAAVLSPLRRRLLENLESPDSATGLARKLGIPRQKINYHLRKLESAGLVELDEEKNRRGCVERYVRMTARAFVISPAFLEGLAANPELVRDRYSSAYLVAMAGRVVRDVAVLRERAADREQRLATAALEAEISFASPGDFKSFSEELAGDVLRLAAKYNRSGEPSSRRFRVIAGIHPVITKKEESAQDRHNRPAETSVGQTKRKRR